MSKSTVKLSVSQHKVEVEQSGNTGLLFFYYDGMNIVLDDTASKDKSPTPK